jgi:hypothetical protein
MVAIKGAEGHSVVALEETVANAVGRKNCYIVE